MGQILVLEVGDGMLGSGPSVSAKMGQGQGRGDKRQLIGLGRIWEVGEGWGWCVQADAPCLRYRGGPRAIGPGPGAIGPGVPESGPAWIGKHGAWDSR